MKVLYVLSTAIEYSSSANMRNIAIIDGLIKNGNTVDLLADGCDKSSKHIDKMFDNIKINKRYNLRNFSNLDNSFSKSFIRNSFIKKIRKICEKIFIYDERKILIRNAKKINFESNYDLIISSSDPKSSHLIAKAIIKKNSGIAKKWIQYWGDPFAADINKKTIMPKFIVRYVEKRILGMADNIVYVSPFTLDIQKKLYKKMSYKMKFLPIPYIKEKKYADTTKNKKPIIGYFGDYYSSDRNIFNLYNSCIKNNFELIICGNSNIKLKKQKNITILERQKQEKINEYEAKCDILICICNKSGTQIPGKVYHYAATNKPILIIVDGNYKEKMIEYFKSFKRYYICENNEDDIAKAIKEIFKSNKKFYPSKILKPENIAKEMVK